MVLLPLSAAFLSASTLSAESFWRTVTAPRVLASLRLSFGAAWLAATVNGVFGGIVAWVLIRYRFPGKRLIDALVDLPFALPTAVAGIALTALYAPKGALGSLLAPLGIQVAFKPLGVVVALVFIGLPFVVRTVQPVLEDLAPEYEEAGSRVGNTTRRNTCRREAPRRLAASSYSGARSSSTGCTVRTTKGRPMKTSATTTPNGLKAT